MGARLVCDIERHAGRIFAWTALLFFASRASADERASVHLDEYTVASGVQGCPNEESFRTEVAASLGYDPFDAVGKKRLTVRIARQKSTTLRGRVEIRAEAAGPPAVRELSGGVGHCSSLVSALASAVAIALDPVVAGTGLPTLSTTAVTPAIASRAESLPSNPPAFPGASGPPRDAPLSDERLTRDVSKPPSSPPRASLSGFAVVGADIAEGLLPGTSLGGHAGVGVAIGHVSVEAVGRIDTGASSFHIPPGQRIEGTVISGVLEPCARFSRNHFAGCAAIHLGALQGSAPDVTNPNLGSSFFAAAGHSIRPNRFSLSFATTIRNTAPISVPLRRT